MEKNKEYDKFIDNDGVVNETAPVVTETQKQEVYKQDEDTVKAIAKIKDTGQKAIMGMMAQAQSFAKTSGRELTDNQNEVLSENLSQVMLEIEKSNGKYNLKNLMIVENGFYSQLVSYARLGLKLGSRDNDIWLDIRYNTKASKNNNKGQSKMYDINLSLQYQGKEKLLIQYGTIGGYKIIDIDAQTIYKNDTFKLTPNKKEILVYDEFEWENDEEEKAYKLNIDNVKCAYASMTVDMNGRDKVYLEVIKKPRILTAKEASTGLYTTDWNTKNKTLNLDSPWIKHPESMVNKTALNVLFNRKKAFIRYSNEFGLDIKATNIDKVNKEFKHDNFVDVETEVQENAGNKEIGVDF